MKTRATDEKGETKDIAESGSTKKATKEDVKKQTTVLMRTLSTIVQTLVQPPSTPVVLTSHRLPPDPPARQDDLPDSRHISMRVRCLRLWRHATNSDQA